MQAVVQYLPTYPEQSPSFSSNLGVVTGAVKATRGNVFGVVGNNANAAARYLQLYDQAGGAPAGAPKIALLVKATDQIIVGAELLTVNGVNFANGIVFGWSTTRDTYTPATAAEHAAFITYR